MKGATPGRRKWLGCSNTTLKENYIYFLSLKNFEANKAKVQVHLELGDGHTVITCFSVVLKLSLRKRIAGYLKLTQFYCHILMHLEE